MKKAIKVLQDKINECENMKIFFEQELLKNHYSTVDQSEIQRLNIGKQQAVDVSKECFDAIDILNNSKVICPKCNSSLNVLKKGDKYQCETLNCFNVWS